MWQRMLQRVRPGHCLLEAVHDHTIQMRIMRLHRVAPLSALSAMHLPQGRVSWAGAIHVDFWVLYTASMLLSMFGETGKYPFS